MRLYCLLEVLYATGLRVSELVSLPLSASRRDARMIVVRVAPERRVLPHAEAVESDGAGGDDEEEEEHRQVVAQLRRVQPLAIRP